MLPVMIKLRIIICENKPDCRGLLWITRPPRFMQLYFILHHPMVLFFTKLSKIDFRLIATHVYTGALAACITSLVP
eukprot:223893-Hanusia_phi.AAC.1